MPFVQVGQRFQAIMIRFRSFLAISVLICLAALAGCGKLSTSGGGGPSNGNSSVVLAMTDTPPSNVSVLSAQVTLADATLNPGNVSLFSSSATVDLTRLQTDIAYIATATSTPAGNYTSVTLTFVNPALTFENDIAPNLAGCALGSICPIIPTAPTFSVTVPITGFTVGSSSVTGLLIDINLDNLLTSTMGEDFSAGTSVTPFTPGGIDLPAAGAEDVVGQVSNLSISNNTFTLTNATATYSLRVDTTSTFFQFPNSACSTPGFGCLQPNQIVSVDIGLQSNGTILARNIVFEDADSSDTEVEGIVTSTNVGSQQFKIVIQTMSALVSGLNIGQNVTVQFPTTLPSSPPFFDLDAFHVDNFAVPASNFSLFAAPADLAVGQQVSIRRNSGSSASTIMADHVRLRSSRVTATVNRGLPNINLTSFPSIFSGHGVTAITAQTLAVPTTIYFEVGKIINSSNVLVGETVSVRGPLFNVSGGGRIIVTTKVVVKP